MEGESSVAHGGAGVGMSPCALSKGQSEPVGCNRVLGLEAVGWAVEEKPPAKYGKGAKM